MHNRLRWKRRPPTTPSTRQHHVGVPCRPPGSAKVSGRSPSLPQTVTIQVVMRITARPCAHPTPAIRQLRRQLGRVGRNLDDEVGVQRGGDPVQERDGGDDAASQHRTPAAIATLTQHQPPRPYPVSTPTGPVEEAGQIALDTAGGKNVEVFSPTIGRQLLDRGLVIHRLGASLCPPRRIPRAPDLSRPGLDERAVARSSTRSWPDQLVRI